MAWFHSSRSCMGAPTILLRPTTTALFPAMDTPAEAIKVVLDAMTWMLIISENVQFWLKHCAVVRLPVCLISVRQPLGVQGMKQSPKSPRESFPAFMLVSLWIDRVTMKKRFHSCVKGSASWEICGQCPTHRHPSLGPRRWWPSPCLFCWWSPAAAAQGVRA